jgi:hypothetical protein
MNMNRLLIPITIIFSWFFILFIFIGCDTVNIHERVVYGDTHLPVVNGKVRQWTLKGYKGKAITNSNGEWTLTVPADTVINLCIYDPKGDYEACFEENVLITPSIESGSHKMIY